MERLKFRYCLSVLRYSSKADHLSSGDCATHSNRFLEFIGPDMSCPPLTNKGGKLYISAEPVDCDLTLSELAVLDYVFVPGVGSIGDTGIEQDVVTYPVTDAGLTPQGKGDAKARNWDVEMMDAPSAARDILDEASAVGNDDNYATRIEWPNGDVEFSIVQVESPAYVKGAASGVRVIRYTMIPSFIPIVTNSIPVASNVVVSGTYFVGDTLTATYDYYSPLGLPESGSVYQWYAAGVAIPGADELTYELSSTDYGSMISFGVTPSDGLAFGNEERTTAPGPVDANPELVFENGADGFWLDPADFNSLWVDEAKTTHPTLPGDVVWWLDDKSGNDNHFGTVSSAARGRLYRWPARAVLENYPRNRLIATDSLSTQVVTTAAAEMTLSFKGAGTVALTGTSTAGPLVGTGPSDTVSLTFTPTAGSLTLTVSGSVTEAQLNPGASRTGYQRVGAGIWDVTEEGQPDCWGVAFDGVTTRYLSTRGISNFVGNKLRMLAGQTKIAPDVAGGVVLTNGDGTTISTVASLIAHTPAGSYVARYRGGPINGDAGSGLLYPSPHSALIDASFATADPVSVHMTVNGSEPIDGISASPAGLSSGTWGHGSTRNGSNFYNGIIWGAILVAEEPDPDTWEVGARQWLSNHNMGGILND